MCTITIIRSKTYSDTHSILYPNISYSFINANIVVGKTILKAAFFLILDSAYPLTISSFSEIVVDACSRFCYLVLEFGQLLIIPEKLPAHC